MLLTLIDGKVLSLFALEADQSLGCLDLFIVITHGHDIAQGCQCLAFVRLLGLHGTSLTAASDKHLDWDD